MFASSSSSTALNPFHYSETQNSPTQQHHHSSAFSPFPAPIFLDDNNNYDLLLNDFLLHPHHPISADQHQPESNKEPAAKAMKPKKKRSSGGEQRQAVDSPPPTRRRTRKKDRHSKICTAKGPRDRRMRLSLQIARKFFDLQDLLGFDKASKTIEWLFTKSKAAIKELTDSLPNVKQCSSGWDGGKRASNSTSESEVVSGILKMNNAPGKKCSKSAKLAMFNAPLAKKCREKARARARERTRVKLMKSKCPDDSAEKSGQPNPNLDSVGSQEVNSLVKGVGGEEEIEQEQQPSSPDFLQSGEVDSDIIGRILGNFNGADFGDDHNLGFPGNWEMNNNGRGGVYCAMPNIKSSSTGNFHEQNPNSIFLTNPNSHQQNPNSIISNNRNSHEQRVSDFIATSNWENPNSAIVNYNLFSKTHDQNPNSVLMNTTDTGFSQSHFFLETQFASSSGLHANKYNGLY